MFQLQVIRGLNRLGISQGEEATLKRIDEFCEESEIEALSWKADQESYMVGLG